MNSSKVIKMLLLLIVICIMTESAITTRIERSTSPKFAHSSHGLDYQAEVTMPAKAMHETSSTYLELMQILIKLKLLPENATTGSNCIALLGIASDDYPSETGPPMSHDPSGSTGPGPSGLRYRGLRLYFAEMNQDKDGGLSGVPHMTSIPEFAEELGATGSGNTKVTEVRYGVCGEGGDDSRDKAKKAMHLNSDISKSSGLQNKREHLKGSGLEIMSMKRESTNVTATEVDDSGKGGATNKSLAVVLLKDKRKDPEQDSDAGLSRTQVVVIVTCSAVIGTFFIIAGVMRIRSCVLRYRANRDAAMSVARRSSAAGFNGTTTVTRRDSASSKVSRQSQPDADDGEQEVDTSQFHSHNTPQHCSDHKPLLPVSSLTGSSDRKCSDRDGSHESLVYVDEDGRKQATVDDDNHHSGSQHRSESDPLLRQSPTPVRSPKHVLLENDNQVENEYIVTSDTSMTSPNKSATSSIHEFDSGRDVESSRDAELTSSRSSRSLTTSPHRHEIFEPGGGSDNALDALDAEIGDAIVNNTSDISQVMENLNTLGNSENQIVEEHFDDQKAESSPKAIQVTAAVNSQRSGSFDTVTGFPIYPARTTAARQYSVDYFEVDDNGLEIINPIFEEDELEDDEDAAENQSNNGFVTTGLNQSDFSESDEENQCYQYGNQTEYCIYGSNRDYCYVAADAFDDYPAANKQSGTAMYGIGKSFIPRTSNQYSDGGVAVLKRLSLSNESRSKGIGLINNNICSSPPVIEGNESGSTDSLNDKSKISRMYSSDSYFGVRSKDKNNPTGSADPSNCKDVLSICLSNTVKSEIIPLSRYNSTK